MESITDKIIRDAAAYAVQETPKFVVRDIVRIAGLSPIEILVTVRKHYASLETMNMEDGTDYYHGAANETPFKFIMLPVDKVKATLDKDGEPVITIIAHDARYYISREDEQ